MKKVVTILGARPQFVKTSVVSIAIKKHAPNIEEIVVHTGQHYDDNMSAIFFDELEISKPDYSLNIGSATHGRQTGEMLIAVEQVLQDVKPDLVLVYGDTNSTLAGALAAAKLNIPIAHVEAGLRSFNKKMPEEINRILTDHMSSILLAPTENAVNNLLNEGIDRSKVHLVGDVMYDVALQYSEEAEQKSKILEVLGVKDKQYILATIHRAENTDNYINLQAIVDGLISLSKNITVVFPVHPHTTVVLEKIDFLRKVTQNIRMISPVGYLDMMILEKHAKTIVTDSGGVQKEAYFYRVPCITLRNETEWVELINNGWNRLIEPEKFGELYYQAEKGFVGNNVELYGDGDAACKIVRLLDAYI